MGNTSGRFAVDASSGDARRDYMKAVVAVRPKMSQESAHRVMQFMKCLVIHGNNERTAITRMLASSVGSYTEEKHRKLDALSDEDLYKELATFAASYNLNTSPVKAAAQCYHMSKRTLASRLDPMYHEVSNPQFRREYAGKGGPVVATDAPAAAVQVEQAKVAVQSGARRDQCKKSQSAAVNAHRAWVKAERALRAKIAAAVLKEALAEAECKQSQYLLKEAEKWKSALGSGDCDSYKKSATRSVVGHKAEVAACDARHKIVKAELAEALQGHKDAQAPRMAEVKTLREKAVKCAGEYGDIVVKAKKCDLPASHAAPSGVRSVRATKAPKAVRTAPVVIPGQGAWQFYTT